jgi:hypothetical protein
MDEGKCTLLIMLDQSAAFDTVSQDILLHRLESRFGITGHAIGWLQSYFKGRTQAVAVNGMVSVPKPLETGFPQGSTLGPYKYPMYTSPMFDIAKKHGISIHMYADDTQVYVSFNAKDSSIAIRRMHDCIEEIRIWMSNNHLKMNNAKTELLLIGNPHVRKQLEGISTFKIGNVSVQPTESARNIGATIDSKLSLVDHVSNVCRSCYMHLHHIGKIRHCLTQEATGTLVHALVTSRIDYVNGILYGLPEYLIRRLELCQNNAARLILQKKKRDHITPMLKELHWLPIQQRILYKINMLTFKAIRDLAPEYLKDLVEVYHPSRVLRSASKNYLCEKRSNLKKAGDRAFSVCAPKAWNKLPEDIMSINDLDEFKKALKTFYFRQAFE